MGIESRENKLIREAGELGKALQMSLSLLIMPAPEGDQHLAKS